MGKIMSVLIIIAALLTGALISVALFSKPVSKNVKSASLLITDTKQQTTLFFEPTLFHITPQGIGKPQSVTIGIDTRTNRVSSLQLELQFNPAILGQVTLQPATGSAVLPQQTKVLYTRVDQTTGRVSLFLNTSDLQGKGPIATLSFIPQTASGSSKIIFLDKTMVTAQGTDLSVLKNTVPLDITTY
jgi:hypothetical protein